MATDTTLVVPLSDEVDTSAVKHNADGTMQLIDTFFDTFDSGTPDAAYTDIEVNNGTVVQSGGGSVEFDSPAGTDAAYRVYDETVDRTTLVERVYSVKFRSNSAFVGSNFPFILFSSASSPTGAKDNATEYLPNLIIDVFVDAAGNLVLRYTNDGATRLSWDAATSVFALGNNTAVALTIDTDATIELHHTDTFWWFVVKDPSDTEIVHTSGVLWTGTKAFTNGWPVMGEMRTDQVQNMGVSEINFPRDTITGSSPAGEWVVAPVGTIFDMDSVVANQLNTANTSVTVTWFKNNSGSATQTDVAFGAVTGDFESTNSNALKMVVKFVTTDTSETPVMGFNALVQAEGGGSGGGNGFRQVF